MSWDFVTTTQPVATKSYHCEASDWITNASLNDLDLSAEHRATIAQAKQEGWKILRGTRYLRMVGKFDGGWRVYRARLDLHQICLQYDLYAD